MTDARPIDALVAEIGSTTTVVSAFDGLTGGAPRGGSAPGGAHSGGDSAPGTTTPRLIGQGVAATTVGPHLPGGGDVTLGIAAARAQLEAATGPLAPRVTLATSSAAGGLRMTVHGLTARMTSWAAREAALGAGAVVSYQTAGLLRDHDLEQIVATKPGLILLAGGVEGGDCNTVLFNAGRLATLPLEPRPIVVYAGNSVVCDDSREILERAGFRVHITRNVYPAIDELDVEPARTVIHDAFEEHITRAPGMERLAEFVTGRILPTPGAVLIAAERLAAALGDLVVVDVGGATTDVHSVTDGSPEIAAIATEPQPHSKRTVEGDLGTFVSAPHTAELMRAAGLTPPEPLPPALPATAEETAAAAALARFCAATALERHAGKIAHLYTPTGRQTVARGRDLTACRLVVGTGGALVRLPGGVAALEAGRAAPAAAHADLLLPPADAHCVLDRDYVLAACGALAASDAFAPNAVVALIRTSTGI